nr:PREDICTED: mucin-5AC-like [Paralichthys olivaceus]
MGVAVRISDIFSGFVCKNSDQTMGKCRDYRVRFQCPRRFCAARKICNNPLQIQVQTTSGASVASTGNVIAVSDKNTGFICKNSNQTQGSCKDYRVRFQCPLDFCILPVCWTKWYDRDNPSGTGDWESLSDLRRQDPKGICDRPLYIDVVTTDTNTPFTSTGQTHYVYSPTQGFVCRNQDQAGRRCHDYKVRFGCPCPCFSP